jgi:hypothetical protein
MDFFTTKPTWFSYPEDTKLVVEYDYTPAWNNPAPLIIQEEPSTDSEVEIVSVFRSDIEADVPVRWLTIAQLGELFEAAESHQTSLNERS